MIRTALFLLVVISSGPVSAQGSDLPDDVRQGLDASFTDWRLPTDADLAVGADPYCQSPLYFDGDFDGDGLGDYITQVIYPNDSDPRGESWDVAILLRREDGFEVHTKPYGGGGMTLHKDEAGSEVYLPMPYDDLTFTLQADGFTIGYCEKVSSIYFYYGGAFLSATTGD